MAAVSNLQLIHRDVASGQLHLGDEHIARARTAPFHGHSLVGPAPQRFDEKIFTMRDQHAHHRGLTSHFKVPKKPDPKSSTQSRPSAHQRLGLPVGQEGSKQSFRNGQQNKSWNSNFFTTPPHAPQEVHCPGTPAEGQGVVVPRRRLDCLRVPTMKECWWELT